MQALPKGGMAAVKCDPALVSTHIAPFRATLSIAAINGPADVVISGGDDLDTVTGRLGRGRDSGAPTGLRRLSLALMEPMLAGSRPVRALGRLPARTLPLVSNVSGQLASGEVPRPRARVRHVREAGPFADGVVTA
jgi:acyl transferase domain-containing protein